MPTFTVSLIASIPVSAQVVIEADNEAKALAIANQMHLRSQLGWTYNGFPIPAFTGPITSIWSNPGVVPPPGPKVVRVVLSVTPPLVAFGTPVVATATVAPGATGLVSFYDGLTLLGTATPNGVGVATLSNIELLTGTRSITSRFAGDLYFAAGTSNTVFVTVTPPATVTTIGVTPNPQFFGSAVNITANVTSGFGVPTGLVLFFDGSVQIGSAALSAGTCNVNITSLNVGSHNLTVAYQGSAGYAASASPTVVEVIQAATIPTTTVVVSDPSSSTFEQTVTFTATVSSNAGPPTSGTVSFLAIPDFGSNIDMGSPNVDGTGTAQVITSFLPVGNYTIQATYNGSAGFLTSVGTTSQVVSGDGG